MNTGSTALTESLNIRFEPRHGDLESRARAFVAEKIRPFESEESDTFALAITKALGEAGLLEAGVELDTRAICLLRELVAASSGLCDSMLALQGLGYAPIALAGSEAQKSAIGPGVRRGETIAALAITEPEAGSDVAAIRTTAKREAGGYRLDGKKCFITNAGIASFYVVFARTAEHKSRGLSAFVVPAERVRLVERYRLIAPHPCGEIALENALIPESARLGEEGDGFTLAMRTLDYFRSTVGAAALGMADRALEEAIDRARRRSQFGSPIGGFQQVGAMLADSFAELSAARLLVYRAATAQDLGDPSAGAISSAAKLLATETAQRVIDRALQIHGGQGVRVGSTVERLYREIRALRIYEGTSEVQRLIISRHLQKD